MSHMKHLAHRVSTLTWTQKYDLKPGDSALVMGAGPIGLGVIQCLKARGAGTIIVAEVARERQNFAKEFGATHLIDPRHEDTVKRAKEITGGLGPHAAFDAAGVPASVRDACLAVRARGTVVNLAIWEKEVESCSCSRSNYPNRRTMNGRRVSNILGLTMIAQVPFQPNNLVFGEKKYLASKSTHVILIRPNHRLARALTTSWCSPRVSPIRLCRRDQSP